MSGFIFKQDLAMAYFSDCSKSTASKLLAREIHSNNSLLAALQSAGYRPTQKRLSPKQVQILYDFLGKP
ncbi:MAG: DUF4248 domain-containing protein [Bacteroidales bacterium]|nr:DUF4248 domain-containing protein [Candidatus Colimorpha pelethequi]